MWVTLLSLGRFASIAQTTQTTEIALHVVCLCYSFFYCYYFLLLDPLIWTFIGWVHSPESQQGDGAFFHSRALSEQYPHWGIALTLLWYFITWLITAKLLFSPREAENSYACAPDTEAEWRIAPASWDFRVLKASPCPAVGGQGVPCSILPRHWLPAQPCRTICRAEGVGYLLNIPLGATAQANTAAFLLGFSQSWMCIKSSLIHSQCCPVRSKASQKFG